RAALKVSPNSNEQLGNLGKALARRGDEKLAIPMLELAVERNAMDAELHRWLIYAYRKADRLSDADRTLARYEVLRGRVFLEAGLAYLRLGEVELAKGQLSLAFSALVRAKKASGLDLELRPASEWLANAREAFLRLPAMPKPTLERSLTQSYLTYLAGD